MTIADILNHTKKFAADNAPAILTGFGVAGVVATAYLTGKAAFRSAEILAEVEMEYQNLPENLDRTVWLEPKEKIQLCWRLYLPAVGMGALTIASIIAANRISDKRAAALAAAVSVGDRLFSEYKEKVKEKIGEKKEQEVRDEIAQDRVNQNPSGNSQVIITGTGDHLCYDMYSGRYFNSNVEAIRKAQNEINHQVLGDSYASLTDFYNKIGLSATDSSDEVGWTADNDMLDVEFSTVLSEDQKPCLAFRFNIRPYRGYWHGHR